MYPVNGQQVPGEEVEFQSDGSEAFNTYLLHDGTKLKFKAVVLKIIRLDMFDQNGDPLYLVQATNALSADVPDSLKRKS